MKAMTVFCATALVAASKAFSCRSLFRGLVRGSSPKRRGIRLFSSFSGNAPAAYRKYSEKDVELMNNILYRVRAVNQMPEEIRSKLLQFHVDGMCVGKVDPSIADRICSIDTVFTQSHDKILTLTKDAGTTFDSRTQAVARVMEKLRDDGFIQGWRDEKYPVSTGFYDAPYFVIERAAAPFLGILEYGVHINGLVKSNDGSPPRMWIARRSQTKSKYPGMLDHIVAGGQPAGLSLIENVVKECMEEAGIPEDLTLAGVRPAGAISYETYSARHKAISRVVLFNYDLYLPPDFTPKPVDGEVDEFFLWTVDEILESMAPSYPDPIKPNCYSVIIDYLLRSGDISPEIPGYLDVVKELRSGDCR